MKRKKLTSKNITSEAELSEYWQALRNDESVSNKQKIYLLAAAKEALEKAEREQAERLPKKFLCLNDRYAAFHKKIYSPATFYQMKAAGQI